MFEWSPGKDKHYFRGMFQSHLLENKIAPQMGFDNKREVYEELERRSEALQAMAERDLTHYDDVFALLGVYYTSKPDWQTFRDAVDTWVSVKER